MNARVAGAALALVLGACVTADENSNRIEAALRCEPFRPESREARGVAFRGPAPHRGGSVIDDTAQAHRVIVPGRRLRYGRVDQRPPRSRRTGASETASR